jgi:predicted RNA-binding protein with PIN domain
MPDAPKYLLVDGHSVIHAWADLRKLHLRGPMRYLAREELLKRMRTLQDMTGERVVVVFDGQGAKITEEREEGGVQIFYADAGHTADSVIERLASKYSEQFRLRVCTADRMIWESIRASGAQWVSPDTLRDDFARSEKDLESRIKRRR